MSDNQIRYAMHLEDGAPSCARAVIERNQSQDAKRHDEDALHRWADDGGPVVEVN